MNKQIIITSDLNPDLLPENERWLVIGPFCWGWSRSLPMAIDIAASQLNYGGGSFTAQVVPFGELFIGNDGSYRVEGWTPEQRERASVSSRVVAITKSAAQQWGASAKVLLQRHRKMEIK